MADSPGRVRWKWVLRIALAGLVFLFALFYWRSLNRLAIVGRTPTPMDVISSDYRPFIKIPKPKGGYWAYPPMPEPHRNWHSVEGAAGIIFTKDKKPIFNQPIWRSSGREFTVIDTFEGSRGYEAICPILYGNATAEFDLIPAAGSPGAIKVRLPASGIEAPEIHSGSVVIGSLRINFMPRAPISPAFPLEYDVRVDGGKKGAMYFLDVSSSFDGDLRSNAALLRIEDGKPALFSLPAWSQRTQLQGALMEVAPMPLKLKVTRKETATSGEVDLYFADGPLFTYVKYSIKAGLKDPFETGIENLRGLVSVEAGKSVAGLVFEQSNGPAIAPDHPTFAQYAMGLKDGQIVEVTGYQRASELWFTGELELPSRRSSVPNYPVK